MKHKKSTHITSKKNKVLYLIVGVSLTLYILFIGIRAFTNSLFFDSKDRINLVVYGQNPAFYSLAIQESRDYIVYFPADLKVQVPGGYGSYRVGSLGKLISLEKKPALYQKTFSLATSSFVNFYFYPDDGEVYYGEGTKDNFRKFTLKDFFFMKSNATFLDRVYLSAFVLNKNIDNFRVLRYIESERVQDDEFFEAGEFTKKSIGLFYQKTYRNDKKTIQIAYNKEYETAESISNTLEGNGIRVSDITLNLQPKKECLVREVSAEHSITAKNIAEFFNCTLVVGNTDVYDIIFELGDRAKDWEVENNL